MATLAENAAAVKAAQVAIDAAIVTKGGTTEGGLTNAAAAIQAIPSGGERGNGLPIGCPRIDLLQFDSSRVDQIYVVFDWTQWENPTFSGYATSADGAGIEVCEIDIANDGTVTETSNKVIANGTFTITTTGRRFVAFRLSPVNKTSGFYTYCRYYVEMEKITKVARFRIPVALKAKIDRGGRSVIADGDIIYNNTDCNYSVSYLHVEGLGEVYLGLILANATINYLFINFRNKVIELGINKCRNLEKLVISGTFGSRLTSLFYGCISISSVDLSHVNLNLLNPNGAYVLRDTPSLTEMRFPDAANGVKADLNISENSILSHDSLVSVIGGLYDMTGDTAKTLTMGATNLAKLTDAEKQVATDKNWILA